MFGELIIMIVYLPILTLEGIEGKLFRPMALTVIFALAGSMVLSLTLMPVLASLLLPQADRGARAVADAAGSCASTTRFCSSRMHHKLAVIGFAAVRAGRGVRHDRPEPRLGVRAAAVGRGDRHQHRAAGGHRPRRVDPLQHADGEGDPGDVPRRGRARLEPHRHGRGRHRSDGRRTDRHVHHAQAARAVDEGARRRPN